MATQTLHQLIRSLSSTEKGYIKKHSSIHVIGEQNKYIKLFDFIDRQTEYNEKEIVKKFKNDPILNNFSVAKNYLFRFIMKALESYHSSVKSELRSTLNQVEILHNKNLPIPAKKLLSKAKSITQQYELYEYMDEIIDWEINLLVEEVNPEDYLESVNHYFEQLYDSIEKKKTIVGYKHLYQKLRAKGLCSGFARNDQDVIEFRKIADEAQKEDSSASSTFSAQYYKNMMQSNFLFMVNEQSDVNYVLQKTVTLLEENPHMIEMKPFTYLGILRNKAINELALLRYIDLQGTVQRMDDFVKQYGSQNKNFELMTENLKLFIYIPSGQFEKALEIAKHVEFLYQQIPSTRTLKKEKQLQHYAFAYIYIGLGEFKLANQHINILLNDTNLDLRSDLFCFAHILSLIIHYELGHNELLEYRIRSTYRLLLRRNKLYEFEKYILAFLRNTQKSIKDSRKLHQHFIELKRNIESLAINNIERNALSLFDIISWLESKIDGISFMEVKQQKFNQMVAFESSNAYVH